MIKIASFGCGVDSVAGLLLSKEQGIEYDEIIFADTLEERPETYAYLEYFEKKSGFKITKVKSHLGKILNRLNIIIGVLVNGRFFQLEDI